MSDIVIRHAEAKRLRRNPSDPCSAGGISRNTLQVPHPSSHMWHERLTDRPGVKQLVASIDDRSWDTLAIEVIQRPLPVTPPISAFAWIHDGTNRGVASELIAQP